MRSVSVISAVAAAAAALVVSSATAAVAQPGSGFTVVADHLNSPRQIAVHDGGLYVAEAGTGGSACLPVGVCVGFTGSVTRVRHGQASRVQTGLLSFNVSDEGEVVGVDAVAFRGSHMYGVATGACGVDLPPDVAAQAGHVLALLGGDRVAAVGDASTIECTTDPDGQGPDTDPYGLAVRGGTFYVADAAGNDVVKIRHGHTSVATVLSHDGQPVPTSLAFGPDGALYIGTLNFEGGPGAAAVYRLAPGSDTATVYATGLTAITGIAFGAGGRLYVSEWTTGFDENGPSPNGDVVAIPWGGGQAGRQVIGAGVLHFPGGVAVTEGGVYVSNWSIAPGEDGPFGPGNHGQLLRFGIDD
jgi:glucose/arabinose dehydrogenase